MKTSWDWEWSGLSGHFMSTRPFKGLAKGFGKLTLPIVFLVIPSTRCSLTLF